MIQTVIRNDEVAPGTFLLAVGRLHDFQPGETVKVGLDDRLPPRIYSICSGNKEHELRILYNIKGDGALTPQLAKVRSGDPIIVSEPGGGFRGTTDPAIWIATGTGIAPFYSMLRSGMGKNKVLIHGVRHLTQFYFSDELAERLGQNYHRCCSAESDPSVYAGRVTGYLAEQDQFPQDQRYYICGQATMAVETRDLLIEKGIPFVNIVTEIYF